MEKKRFLNCLLALFLIWWAVPAHPALEEGITADQQGWSEMRSADKQAADRSIKARSHVTLFITGDVMTGRGIDQVLPFAGDPVIHEGWKD